MDRTGDIAVFFLVVFVIMICLIIICLLMTLNAVIRLAWAIFKLFEACGELIATCFNSVMVYLEGRKDRR